MVTIRDVAREANVSVATVSRVLNQSDKVRPETKKHVKSVMKSLAYQPNDIARTLFKGKSKMIALLVPDIMNPFFPEVARAAEDIANKYGYTVILCNTDDNAEKERTYLGVLKQKSVDGIIMVSSTFTKILLDQLQVPMIVLDRHISSDMASITVNNRAGARLAVEHLKRMGCKKIGHIRGPDSQTNAHKRMLGYLDIVSEEPWFDPSYIETGDFLTDTAYEATRTLMDKHPDIDGIFAANDLMALGVLRVASDLGIAIPAQLAVIGFDGIQLGQSTMPTLSTMAQPIYEIGSHAAEALINHLQSDDPSHELIEPMEYEVTLIQRGSTNRRKADYGN